MAFWGSGYDPFFVQDCVGLPWWGSVVQLDWSTSQPSREWYTSPVNVKHVGGHSACISNLYITGIGQLDWSTSQPSRECCTGPVNVTRVGGQLPCISNLYWYDYNNNS